MQNEIVEWIKVLDIHPGDALVLKCSRPLLNEMAVKIKADIRVALGERFKDVRVLVLDPSMDLEILRKKELEP